MQNGNKGRITSGCSGQMSTFAADPSVGQLKMGII